MKKKNVEKWMLRQEVAQSLGISVRAASKIFHRMFEADPKEGFTARDKAGRRRFDFAAVVKFIQKESKWWQ